MGIFINGVNFYWNDSKDDSFKSVDVGFEQYTISIQQFTKSARSEL